MRRRNPYLTGLASEMTREGAGPPQPQAAGMTEGLDRKHQSSGRSADIGGTEGGGPSVPLCFVVDEEASIRHFLSLILHGAGIDTEEFGDTATFRKAMERKSPDLVFLNVGLESADAIESVVGL